MTTIPSSTVTTIRIRHGASTALSMSYDFTGLGTSMPASEKFQSLIDQAITQWWSGLTSFQRSALPALELSLKISGQRLALLQRQAE